MSDCDIKVGTLCKTTTGVLCRIGTVERRSTLPEGYHVIAAIMKNGRQEYVNSRGYAESIHGPPSKFCEVETFRDCGRFWGVG
jgi:hypothetical protein